MIHTNKPADLVETLLNLGLEHPSRCSRGLQQLRDAFVRLVDVRQVQCSLMKLPRAISQYKYATSVAERYLVPPVDIDVRMLQEQLHRSEPAASARDHQGSHSKLQTW